MTNNQQRNGCDQFRSPCIRFPLCLCPVSFSVCLCLCVCPCVLFPFSVPMFLSLCFIPCPPHGKMFILPCSRAVVSLLPPLASSVSLCLIYHSCVFCSLVIPGVFKLSVSLCPMSRSPSWLCVSPCASLCAQFCIIFPFSSTGCVFESKSSL